MSETIKFSEIPENELIGHDGKILTREEAYDLILKQQNGAMVLVSERFANDMLDIHPFPDTFELPADSKRIIVDLVPARILFKGNEELNFDYIDLTHGKVYPVAYNDVMDVPIFEDSGIVVVLDDAGDEHEILFGDYEIVSLINEQEVGQSDENTHD